MIVIIRLQLLASIRREKINQKVVIKALINNIKSILGSQTLIYTQISLKITITNWISIKLRPLQIQGLLILIISSTRIILAIQLKRTLSINLKVSLFINNKIRKSLIQTKKEIIKRNQSKGFTSDNLKKKTWKLNSLTQIKIQISKRGLFSSWVQMRSSLVESKWYTLPCPQLKMMFISTPNSLNNLKLLPIISNLLQILKSHTPLTQTL